MEKENFIQNFYSNFADQLKLARKKFNRPLTLAEKILATHVIDIETQEFKKGESYLVLKPDRVAMQDATAQMAILQFMLAGRKTVASPTTVHCDHLIQARIGAAQDMQQALKVNKEVYDFLRSASQKYGIGFWNPGAGIIHQVIFENYAMPGLLMIGTDSHTPNGGGMGMLAIGVGGSDAADVMSGLPWEVKCPKLIGVHLKGALNGWTASKDVILKLCGILTTSGGTDKIIEYFGPGTRSISATGKGTITNMGAELGATTSLFPYDERIATYLKATRRGEIVTVLEPFQKELQADPEIEKNPKDFFDEIVEIDLSTLEPYVVGPHSPDVARAISQMAKEVDEKKYPSHLSAALIGSCTNSSYEDIGRAAAVAAEAKSLGLKAKSYFLITPGSDQIYNTIQRDGQLKTLTEMGGTVLANACGPCIGQWKREDIKPGTRNSIITSFNRNFPKRNDGSAETLAFIGSPELVTAMALAGDLRFNPLKDTLTAPNGQKIKLTPPSAPELPSKGFVEGEQGFIPPIPESERAKIEIEVSPQSERLKLLQPFEKWKPQDFEKLAILVKAKGQCTTDHISPAGPWLKYRGHLDKISDNMFSGAINSFNGETGIGKDILDGQIKNFSATARHYQANHLGWVAIGDQNYGEGSSREHAAMSPRHLGCKVVIAKSFARLHETNLKKQGILALKFSNPSDYDQIKEDDRISIKNLAQLTPGKPVIMILHHADGKMEILELKHSFTPDQIEWFKAGSALNLIRSKEKEIKSEK
ncbi:MAG: aconitate hydratase [Chlamydiae bacterium]|nr:aconitate hydratase [Chlamydiota bacterium]MBI3277317.1 aconitate hydratase [Chlamydiota bacterium]